MDFDLQTAAFILTIIFLGVSFLVIGKFASLDLPEHVPEHKS